jgi:hypothetical protein
MLFTAYNAEIIAVILRTLFKRLGLEQAKNASEKVVEVTKFGLAKGDFR